MARYIRQLQVMEISSVDKAANEHARVMFMKRHTEERQMDIQKIQQLPERSLVAFCKTDAISKAQLSVLIDDLAQARRERGESREQAYAKFITGDPLGRDLYQIILTIVLTDLLANPTSDGQAISAITFTMTGATGSGALVTTNSGNISTIASNGTYTTPTSDALTRWQATETGTSIGLTTLTGGQPNRLIIGPPNSGTNTYTGSGLASVVNHDPVAFETATFDITVPGTFTLTDLSNVVFQFGTTAGSNLVTGQVCGPPSTIGCPSTQLGDTPLPAALPLFATGLGAFGLLGWRRKRKASAALAA